MGGRAFTFWATLAVVIFQAAVFARNGQYGTPTIASYRRLTTDQRRRIEATFPRLFETSYYCSPKGASELRTLAKPILETASDYDRISSIGRSPSGLLSYLRGYFSTMKDAPELADIPFSMGEKWHKITEEERVALREHLRANGLTPREIAKLRRRILFIDTVQSGKGSLPLLQEIVTWANEEKIGAEVKEKLHFFALFPTEKLVREMMMDIYHRSVREMGFAGFRPQPPTEIEISELVREYGFPSKNAYLESASSVRSTMVSTIFFQYVGFEADNTQESFTPKRWVEKFDRNATPEFSDHIGELPFTELYYLIQQGEQDGQLGPCSRELTFPAP